MSRATVSGSACHSRTFLPIRLEGAMRAQGSISPNRRRTTDVIRCARRKYVDMAIRGSDSGRSGGLIVMIIDVRFGDSPPAPVIPILAKIHGHIASVPRLGVIVRR